MNDLFHLRAANQVLASPPERLSRQRTSEELLSRRDDNWNQPETNAMTATYIKSGQIAVDHGTAAAALITAVEGRSR